MIFSRDQCNYKITYKQEEERQDTGAQEQPIA